MSSEAQPSNAEMNTSLPNDQNPQISAGVPDQQIPPEVAAEIIKLQQSRPDASTSAGATTQSNVVTLLEISPEDLFALLKEHMPPGAAAAIRPLRQSHPVPSTSAGATTQSNADTPLEISLDDIIALLELQMPPGAAAAIRILQQIRPIPSTSAGATTQSNTVMPLEISQDDSSALLGHFRLPLANDLKIRKYPVASTSSGTQSNNIVPPEVPSALQGQSMPSLPNHEYLQLSQAIIRGDLQGVRDYLDDKPDALTAWIDCKETPLLKACLCGQVEIVNELLGRMTPQQLLSRPGPGHNPFTPLTVVARSGNMKIAEALIGKNPELANFTHSNWSDLPVVRAANSAQKEMTHYLYDRTSPEVLLPNGAWGGMQLLVDAICFGYFDIVSRLLDVLQPQAVVTKHPKVALIPISVLASCSSFFRSSSNLSSCQRLIYSMIQVNQAAPNGLTAKILQCLSERKWFGINRMYELKLLHNTAYNILQVMCDKTSQLPKYGDWTTAILKALVNAVSFGNREFVIEIIRHNPELMWFGPDGRDIFMMAVGSREERIFELFFGLDDRKHDLINRWDDQNNRILHIAGGLSPPEKLSRVAGAALQMQREIQWFKEIESIVPEKDRWKVNDEKPTGLTGRQVFERDHKELRAQAEKWMKDTATACSLVAVLIATITFQAVFTSPGGTNGDDGVPFHIRYDRFIAFVIADVLSFFSASTSLVVFLVILTSRFSSDDFHKSLPTKMILGLLTLFISIATMLAAFSAALLTIVSKAPSIVVPVMPLVGVPALLFMLMQYPLLKEMVSSTFGKGLFNRDTKPWF